MNIKKTTLKMFCMAALLTMTSSTVIADPCTSEDYYWCNYYYAQCLANGGDGGTCEPAYLACLVSVGCTPP